MLISENTYEGIPARLYRSTSEIKRDMDVISKKIYELDEALSIRNILMELISEWADAQPEKWIPELEEIVDEARESLCKLERLKVALTELTEELSEAKWARG